MTTNNIFSALDDLPEALVRVRAVKAVKAAKAPKVNALTEVLVSALVETKATVSLNDARIALYRTTGEVISEVRTRNALNSGVADGRLVKVTRQRYAAVVATPEEEQVDPDFSEEVDATQDVGVEG